MIINPFDSSLKKSNLLIQQTILAKESIIRYMTFYLLHCIIDLLLLIFYAEHLKYTVPKFGIDVIITLLIFCFPNKVSHLQLNIFLSITKVTSQLFILLIGNDFILILVFICEANEIPLQQKGHYLIQLIITKISCLIVITINQSIMEIVIILCVLIFEMYRVLLFYQERNTIKHSQLVGNQYIHPKENQQFVMKESTWISRIQLMPLCLFVISMKDLKLIFFNQFSTSYFSNFCISQENLEVLILEKLQFQTVHRKSQKNGGLQNQFFRTLSKAKQKEKDTEGESYTTSETSSSLKDILRENFITKLPDKSMVLELRCQHKWDEDKLTEFTGSVKVNIEEGEIMLFLIDITNEQRSQEELIKNQFKAQIVQSFSHELRTPLNSACNYLSCCLSDRNLLDYTKQTFIKPAYNALRLQSHLINDIIDFNSYYAQDFETSDREFYIKDLIDEVHSLFQSSLELKQLALYVDLFENEQTCITTDFSRLTQIIVNILQNSIRYSNSGLILIKMTSYSSSHIKFTIKDEGIGIDDERLLQLHQMLSDIEQKKDFTKYKSWHGFGLLISQVLLTKLSPPDYKSLLIRSEGEGQGTKVIFYIQNQNKSESNISSNYCQKTLRFIGKAKLGQMLHQPSINGTIIQICDVGVRDKMLNYYIKLPTYKKSMGNSLFTDSCINFDDVNHKMCELNHVQPFLMTDLAFQPLEISNEVQNQVHGDISSGKDLTSKVLSYKKMKMLDDQESENQLKSFLKRKKCSCSRILSIDDEIFNQKSIQLLLSRQGFEIILVFPLYNQAFNGEEALAIVKSISRCSPTCNLFLFILTDYQMPIMDGVQTTKILRQMMEQSIIPKIHIVGLTAFNSKKDIKSCIDAGMSDVLSKPLNLKEFFEILNAL